jgi:hypothetical protein
MIGTAILATSAFAPTVLVLVANDLVMTDPSKALHRNI